MQSKTFFINLFSIVALAFFSGCAKDFSTSNYDSSTVGETASTYECVVKNVRKISIHNNETGYGPAAGALVGAGLGASMGGGNARYITGGLGMLGGHFVGKKTEEKMTEQYGFEYTVTLNNGKMKTVIQGLDIVLNPGTKAYLIVYQSGRSKLIPMKEESYSSNRF